VLKIFFIVCGKRHFEADIFALDIWEKLFLFENADIHDIFEISFGESSIPIIHNVASVHDLTENVNQIFKWNFRWAASSLHVSVKNEVAVS